MKIPWTIYEANNAPVSSEQCNLKHKVRNFHLLPYT